MSHEATHLLGAFTAERARVPEEALPDTSIRAPAPDDLQCLRCQLLGRRRLLCSRGEVCRELPHVYPLGPILLAGWLATAVAFVIAVM